MRWHIYTLSHPDSGEVRYVGWTVNPAKRLRAHVKQCYSENTYKAKWIRSLRADRLEPVMAVVQSGDGDGWAAAERRWIAQFRALGARLVNLTEGGDGTLGCFPSKATRAKMSASRKGRRLSPETVERVRLANLGKKRSPEMCAQMSEARKGKVPVAATLAAAERTRGARQSAEHVEARIAPLRGRARANFRQQHRRVDGVDHWLCKGNCARWLPTEMFTRCATRWNGITRLCRECHATNQRSARARRPLAPAAALAPEATRAQLDLFQGAA